MPSQHAKPLHTALLTWDFPPSLSGLSRAAHDIASSLAEAGTDVTVFNGSLPFGEKQVRDGLTIIGCAADGRAVAGWTRKRGAIGHLVAPYYFAKAVRAAHRVTPFDLVESTNWYAPAYFLRNGPVPLVVRNSTPASDVSSEGMNLRNRLDLRFAHKLERDTAVAADATISNTATHKALIERVYEGIDPNHHHVISLALAPDMLAAGAAAPWPPRDDTQSVVFVGRAERRKGYREALGGFARACAVLESDAVLHVVGMEDTAIDGDTSLAADLAPVRDRLIFHPKASDALLFDLYATASAVLAPSRYESFGLVYREAAAFGRPLVACAQDPAATEFIRATGCGLLAKDCTAEAVCSALTIALQDTEKAAIWHANGIAHAAGLTRDHLARQTLAVYREAIAAHAQTG